MPAHEMVHKRRSCIDAKGTVQASHDVRLKSPANRKVDADTHSDTVDADHIEGPAGRQLTRQRRDILERLGEVSSELAEAYEAALWLVDDHSIPARGRLLAHCARELINKLPDHLDVPIDAKRVEYENALDRIAVLWQDLTHKHTSFGHVAHGVADESSVVASAQVTVSNKLFGMIDRLVKDHLLSRTTISQRVTSALQPQEQPGTPFSNAQLETFLHHWKYLSRWFAGHAHLPNPGSRALDFAECEHHFETLEHILHTTLCPFYAAVEELDDILEEANRRTG